MRPTMSPTVAEQLQPLVTRRRCEWLAYRGALGLAVLAIIIAPLLLTSGRLDAAIAVGIAGGLTGFSLLRAAGRWRAAWPQTTTVAREVEQHYPELDCRLLSCLEAPQNLQPVSTKSSSAPRGIVSADYFRQRLEHEVLQHAEQVHWTRVIDAAALCLAFATVLTAGSAVLVEAAVIGTAWPSRAEAPTVLTVEGPEISPGDIELERGSPLLWQVRFAAPQAQVVTCERRMSDGETITEPLSRSLEDPIYVGRMAAVDESFEYRIRWDDQSSRWFQLTVYELPKVEHSEIAIKPPAWLAISPVVEQRPTAVSVVAGSDCELTWQLNQPVATAELVDASGRLPPIPLIVPTLPASGSKDLLTLRYAWQATTSARWQLQLTDAAGRPNRTPWELSLQVTQNEPALAEMVFPSSDQKVSPLQELELEARFGDDWGLVRGGLLVEIPGQEPRELVLIDLNPDSSSTPLNAATNTGEHRRTVTLALEDFHLTPGSLVMYSPWAEDRGPAGEVRRTVGQIGFAEVRPFDEIFRQMSGGGAAASGSSPQGNQIEDLITQEKEIVSALWNLLRAPKASPQSDARGSETRPIDSAPVPGGSQRSTSTGSPANGNEKPVANRNDSAFDPVTPTAAAALDDTTREAIQVLHLAQRDTSSKLQALAEKLKDPRLSQLALEALRPLSRVEAELQTALADGNRAPLTPALREAQAGYQGLLRLRALEHIMMQGQGSGSGNGSPSVSTEQLTQLELDNKRQRYESDRKPPALKAAAEQLAWLKELKQLAQRQQSLQEQIRDLQTQMSQQQQAEPSAEQRRQLKRLRDDQQQLLAELDELRQRAEQRSGQQGLTEQLRQARDQLLSTEEALSKGELSSAAAAGTRAADNLDELHEQLRQDSAAGLASALTELRQESRELIRNEQALADAVDQLANDQRPTLSRSRQREQLAEQFREQTSAVTNLLDGIRDLVQQAETVEPLVAERLYQAVQQTRRRPPEELLEQAAQGVADGRLSEAQRLEQAASQSLQQLGLGVEAAAESVLGSELAALKRARREVQSLTKSLQSELAQSRDNANEGSSADALAELLKGNSNASGKPGDAESGQKSAGSTGQPDDGAAPNDSKPPAAGSPADSSAAPGTEGAPASSAAGQAPGGSSGRGRAPGLKDKKPPGQPSSPSAGSESGGQTAGFGGGPGAAGNAGQLTPFQQWSQKLQSVENLLSDQQLQQAAATVRGQARSLRAEALRHAANPNWDLVESEVLQPLTELEQRIAEEIARRESPEALVPADRDPIPQPYRGLVGEYYERLGRGSR